MEVKMIAESVDLVWEGTALGDSDNLVEYHMLCLVEDENQRFGCDSKDILVRIRKLKDMRNARLTYYYAIEKFIDSCFIPLEDGKWTDRNRFGDVYDTRSELFDAIIEHSLHILVYRLSGLEADREI